MDTALLPQKTHVHWYTAPIQNEIAECGAAKSLVDLLVPGKEDDGSITMAIKVLDNMVAEGTVATGG